MRALSLNAGEIITACVCRLQCAAGGVDVYVPVLVLVHHPYVCGSRIMLGGTVNVVEVRT